MLIDDINSYTAPIRLENSSSSAEGRVEVFHKGAWGSICDQSWDLNDGHVVCRMMGYSHATNISCCSRYGQGRGSILLSGLGCTGSENSVFNCKNQKRTNQSCNHHTHDAGVRCSGICTLLLFQISMLRRRWRKGVIMGPLTPNAR